MMAAIVVVAGERYEVVRALVGLAEAQAGIDAAAHDGERALARQRVDDAMCRVARWRRGDD